jgi:glutamine cyclotransferase
LRVIEPNTLAVIARTEVRDNGRSLTQINELEMVNGELLANLWHSSRVAVIDPLTGAVRGWFDFADLVAQIGRPPGWDANENVLNGMAFDAASGHLFVTGKRWPTLFEVRLGGCRGAVPKTPLAAG